MKSFLKFFAYSLLTISCFLLHEPLKAQMPGGGNKDMMKLMKDIKGRVYGKIIDANTKKPVEFASVVVLWYNKDSAIAGGFTGENGEFNIDGLPAMGGFRMRITQIGYKKNEFKFFVQAPNKLEQDLGNIKMEVDEKILNEVEVVGEKSTFQLAVDRKVYNVEKDLSVRGGLAIDVLKNVPTITVDGEGNATLREKAVMIYVDGRPTNLSINQIPADAIEKVEVISNPGAKYEAAATGGIVNIVLKKNRNMGYNGMLMGNVGTQDRYGITGNINVKENPFNVSLMYSLNATQTGQTFGFTKRRDFNYLGSGSDLLYEVENNTLSRTMFQFARASVDYNINIRNNIGVSYNVVQGDFSFDEHQNFNTKDDKGLMDTWGHRHNVNKAGFQNHTAQLTYRKTFPTPDKELTVDATYNQGGGPSTFTFNTYNYAKWGADTVALPFFVSKNNGGSKNNMATVQIDFVNPLSDGRKFEAGARFFYKFTEFRNNIQGLTSPSTEFVKDTTQSDNYNITDMVNAAYATYTGKTFWNIGYQAGLRFEQTYYSGTLLDKGTNFFYNYPSNRDNLLFSLFPSAYFSKKVGKHEFQTNFSRKIQRPNFFQAMPFVMFADARNYRIGNPALKPEMINMAEVNYNNVFGKGNFLSSAYLHYHEQPISSFLYQAPGNPSVTVNTFANGKDQWRYGFENTLRLNLHKNFNASINADVFYVYLKSGMIEGQPETVSEGWSYKGKLSMNYTLPWQIQMQVNGNYEAPKAILNGMSREVYFMDFSLNKMYKMKWIFNFTISDVFNTKQFGYYVTANTFEQEFSRRRETRFIRFSVTYLFGKFDTSIMKRFRGNKGGDGGQQGGMMDGGNF